MCNTNMANFEARHNDFLSSLEPKDNDQTKQKEEKCDHHLKNRQRNSTSLSQKIRTKKKTFKRCITLP